MTQGTLEMEIAYAERAVRLRDGAFALEPEQAGSRVNESVGSALRRELEGKPTKIDRLTVIGKEFERAKLMQRDDHKQALLTVPNPRPPVVHG
jgi:hypothetical protein